MINNEAPPVWLITGCSGGFGRKLAEAVLARGWRLVATARDPAKISDIVAGADDRALALKLDVTDPDQIRTALANVMARFGRIDTLVNNAGWGYATSIEEGEEQAIRDMFATNVFGLADMIRQTLPILRAQRSGWVVNISSMGGIVGNPGMGYYAASKFAVEGLSDALAKEVSHLGIKVLVVEPGPFRTEFRDSVRRQALSISDYNETVGTRMRSISASVKQPGDPARPAEAIIQAIIADKPPMRLVLGSTALRSIRAKLASVSADVDAWEAVAREADFPEHRENT